jgi:hypothetical protein
MEAVFADGLNLSASNNLERTTPMPKSTKHTVRVPVLTPSDEPGRAELVEADVSRREASLAGRYWAVGYVRFLETGDVAVLEEFEDKTVGGFTLTTDPDAIEEFDDRFGQFDFQEIYRS